MYRGTAGTATVSVDLWRELSSRALREGEGCCVLEVGHVRILAIITSISDPKKESRKGDDKARRKKTLGRIKEIKRCALGPHPGRTKVRQSQVGCFASAWVVVVGTPSVGWTVVGRVWGTVPGASRVCWVTGVSSTPLVVRVVPWLSLPPLRRSIKEKRMRSVKMPQQIQEKALIASRMRHWLKHWCC